MNKKLILLVLVVIFVFLIGLVYEAYARKQGHGPGQTDSSYQYYDDIYKVPSETQQGRGPYEHPNKPEPPSYGDYPSNYPPRNPNPPVPPVVDPEPPTAPENPTPPDQPPQDVPSQPGLIPQIPTSPVTLPEDPTLLQPELEVEELIAPVFKDELPEETGVDTSAAHIPHQVLVLLVGTSDKQREIQSLEEKYKLKQAGSFPLHSINSTLGVFTILGERGVPETVEALTSDSIVAQPSYYYKSLVNESLQYGLHKIKADAAHKLATGRGVKVAVIDTGVDYNHKVLQGRVALKADYINSDENGFSKDLHGTSIAGVIAAAAEAGAGIIGVAPDVKIMAIKACWSDTKDPAKATCSSDKLARAVDFAILNKADIINFSLGGPKDKLLTMLIKKAVDSGITVVAAAGNSGSKGKPVFPAALDEVVAVSATDSSDGLYEFSTRGGYIDVAAPGVDIFSPAPGDRWHVSSGTSMAAAHVTGVVALLLQKSPELSPFEVKALLGSTSVDLGKPGKDKEFGEGRIDALQALQKLVGKTEARR